MKFGLTNNVIEEIQQVLATNPKIEKAIIFGSRAKGNYKDGSDIDIAIKGENLKLDDFLPLEVKLDDLNLPYNIDLINYADIKEPALTEHIDRVGIELYSRWKEWTFSHFVEINPAVKLSGAQEYPFVEMKDLQDGIKTCMPSTNREPSGGARFQEGDTLFARITPCLENGKICQVKGLEGGVGFGSTEFLVFRGKQGISDTDFAYYLARWGEVREFAERNFIGTSGRQRVPKDCFDNLRLLLPPLEEQRAIANVLNSLDNKIDLLHRQNKTLEFMAEVLFKMYFNNENRKGTIGEYIKVRGGFAFKSESFKDQGFAGIIKITNISMGSVDIVNTQFVDKEIVDSLDPLKFMIKSGDFLIAMTGAEIGKIGIVEDTEATIWLNQRVGKIIEKIPFGSLVGYMALRSKEGQDHITNSCSGSAQENISSTGLEGMEFETYSEDITTAFGKAVKPVFVKITFNFKKIRMLVHLRDTLLPKLLSGEVRVKMS